MNKNVIVGALVVVSIVLFIFVKKFNEENSSPTGGKNDNVTTINKDSNSTNTVKENENTNTKNNTKTYSEEEFLEKLKGYWVISSDVKINGQDYQYQFNFKDILNPDLKNGHKTQGILFCNSKDNNAIQTISTLEPSRIEQNKYIFEIKKIDISKFYSQGIYDDEGTYNQIIVKIVNDEVFFDLVSDNMPEAAVNLKANKINLDILEDFKLNMSAIKSDDKAKVTLDLSKIKNIENDFGTVKYKSDDCKGDSQLKIRPLSDKLILATSGFGSTCVESITLKIAKGNNNTFQALVYRRNQVPFELNFSK